MGDKVNGSNGFEEKVTAKKLKGEVVLGDFIWVKLDGDSWWPAQFVDENTISECNKPDDRSGGPVLVRLYGSYEYLYVDPTKSRSEFEIVLKQNNGSYRAIFEKALEQERLECGKSKRKRSKPKEERRMSKTSTPKQDKPKQDKRKIDSPVSGKNSIKKSPELSARRSKVMQSLGLIAPCGSPFRRNGQISDK